MSLGFSGPVGAAIAVTLSGILALLVYAGSSILWAKGLDNRKASSSEAAPLKPPAGVLRYLALQINAAVLAFYASILLIGIAHTVGIKVSDLYASGIIFCAVFAAFAYLLTVTIKHAFPFGPLSILPAIALYPLAYYIPELLSLVIITVLGLAFGALLISIILIIGWIIAKLRAAL